jgi:LPXTG-site transpeptidase (sortase) family protein
MLVSSLHHRAAQEQRFNHLRKALALGTAPVSQTDSTGRLLASGIPVALLDIPSIHVHEVVGEGTTAGVLMTGPGHRRDTALPGQAGTSIIMGRQASYGGPFRDIHRLHVGSKIVVTTQQGVSSFKVIDLRRGGDPTPPKLGSGKGRLTLITASGTPFMPSGSLRVDADLTTDPMTTPPTVIPFNGLPRSEQAMATDSTTLWALVLWLQALVIIAVAIVWSWTRWGRHQTWIVFLPLTALVGFFVADQFARLLPNLL